MKKHFIAALAALGFSLAAAPEITVNFDSAKIYEPGDKLMLHIEARDGGNSLPGPAIIQQYTDSVDTPYFTERKEELPVFIPFTCDRPGFVRFEMSIPDPAAPADNAKRINKSVGAAFAPEEIEPSAPRPDDFDAFWQRQLDRLAAVPLKELERVEIPVTEPEYAGKLVCYDVKVECVDGVPVSGYLIMPKGAAPKSLPAVVTYQGAGVYSARKPFNIAIHGAMVLEINAHGIANGKPQEFYDKLGNGELAGYYLRGTNDREKCYFLDMFLRVKRSLDYMKSLPEWNGRNLIAGGGSQGGLQTVVAAALDSAVTFAAPQAPWLCDVSAPIERRLFSVWPGFVKLNDDGSAVDPAVVETMRYFDAVNFAPRVTCDTFVTVGLTDYTCPPTGVMMMYNQLASKNKSWKMFPNENHAGPKLYQAGTDAIIARIDGLKK
ncbi:MAG: acetylxylan esterase [Victivallaceae bacterium]|nr:acetylxylan esterase [Victivallaceae bacterium]